VKKNWAMLQLRGSRGQPAAILEGALWLSGEKILQPNEEWVMGKLRDSSLEFESYS